MTLEHGHAVVDDLRLHYVAAGPADGEPVFFLHGFPEFWYTWRHQLSALAAAGYRVIAPDLRGYNRSEKPAGIDAYGLDVLARDVAGLVHELADGTAAVVGHDWGGVVAWETAAEFDVVSRLVILNAPHPRELVDRLSPDQARRSWYAGAFQLPWLPEAVLGADSCRLIGAIFREGPTEPDAFTDADVVRLRRAAARPGALRSMVNYYRAFARDRVTPGLVDRFTGALFSDGEEPDSLEVPTLVCWGERDAALSTDRVDGLDQYVSDLRVERFPEASHWLHRDRPEAVTAAIDSHLS